MVLGGIFSWWCGVAGCRGEAGVGLVAGHSASLRCGFGIWLLGRAGLGLIVGHKLAFWGLKDRFLREKE